MTSEPTKGQPITKGFVIGLVIVLLLLFAVYSCGPEFGCLIDGGEPARNAMGAEWCELDGDNLPSDGDVGMWW